MKVIPQFILRHQLKQLLNERHMRPIDLAREIGIAKQVISDWLAGSRPRNLEQVKIVADFFHISIDALCFGSKNDALPPHQESKTVPMHLAGIFEINLRYLGPSLEELNAPEEPDSNLKS